MTCKGCLECLLKLLNFLLTLVGLAMIGYGSYLFVQFKRSSNEPEAISPTGADALIQFGRPIMMALPFPGGLLDNLPEAWFIYLFIGVGAVLFVISCFGCVGAATRNGCCLTCYSILVMLLILLEVGCAAFIFFDKSWEEDIPKDKTGYFDMIYDFLKKHWDIVQWVALGAVILEALVFLLTLIVRAVNAPADYDSDDELINVRQRVRRPLIRKPTPATGIPVTGNHDQRPNQSDAWSARMREKYGLNTSEFTYNPSTSSRFQPVITQPAEEPSRCAIM